MNVQTISSDSPSARARSLGVRNGFAIGAIVLVAAILLYLSLRGIEWKVVGQTIASIRPAYAAAAIALSLVPMILRAARWRILLQAKAPVAFKTAFWAVAAGYFGNNFLPARGGELVRSYIVRERSALSGSYVLATALTERVADAVALVIVGVVLLLALPAAGLGMKAARGSFAVIGAVGLAGIVCLPLIEKPVDRMLRKWPRLQTAAGQIVLGIRSLHDGRRLFFFTALTVAIWSLDAITTTTLAKALSISMPISVAMLLIVALSLSSALPSAPGYVGVYQFVAVTVLKPFGISTSVAIAFMIVTQAISYAVTSVLGLLAVTRFTRIDIRKASAERLVG